MLVDEIPNVVAQISTLFCIDKEHCSHLLSLWCLYSCTASRHQLVHRGETCGRIRGFGAIF